MCETIPFLIVIVEMGSVFISILLHIYRCFVCVYNCAQDTIVLKARREVGFPRTGITVGIKYISSRRVLSAFKHCGIYPV